jgi:hypothetical protein
VRLAGCSSSSSSSCSSTEAMPVMHLRVT